MTAPRPVGLVDMLRAGGRAVSQYTGTFLGLFLAQAMIALGAGFVMQAILASAFATRPRFDQGVDGDLAALIEALRNAGPTIEAIGWVGFGAVLLWAMLSWFLAGGLIAVLAERPRGRLDTGRSFGTGGASHFFVFARLGVLSFAGHVLVVFLLMLGLGAVYPRIAHALTLGDVVGSLVAGITPALIAMGLLWTIIDHARVELVLRRDSNERFGALQAFGRATIFVFRRPVAIAHVLLWAAAFLAVSLLYLWAAHGHAMLGASGAVALLVVREGLALVRMGLKVALVGGQVELGQTRPAPPRVAVTEPK